MTSFKTIALSAATLIGVTLGACGEAPLEKAPKVEDVKVETPTSTSLALPADANGLQAEMIKSFDLGDMARFNAAKTAYVETLTDRRQQRDFVNQLWEGKDGYEQRRDIAFPIARDLSDAYDIGAPTYLAGFGYWLGEGTEKDLGKTLEYWAKPSQSGNPTVTYRRAAILLDSEQAFYNPQQGRALMQEAANNGNAKAADWLRAN